MINNVVSYSFAFVGRDCVIALSKSHKHIQRFVAPRQLIAAILRDTTPELDAVLADLHALDAAAAGLLAARSRAANQDHQPAWIDKIDEVLSAEMQRCSRKIEKARNA